MAQINNQSTATYTLMQTLTFHKHFPCFVTSSRAEAAWVTGPRCDPKVHLCGDHVSHCCLSDGGAMADGIMGDWRLSPRATGTVVSQLRAELHFRHTADSSVQVLVRLGNLEMWNVIGALGKDLLL